MRDRETQQRRDDEFQTIRKITTQIYSQQNFEWTDLNTAKIL